MTKQSKRTEGMVLHLLPFGDYDQIATIFTRENGVIKLIIKGGMSHKRQKNAPLSALTRAEFVYTVGRGELHTSQEITPLERYHHHNRSFAHLETACAMVQALRQSQLLEKPAPMLYELLLLLLKGLENSDQPRTWLSAFLLKILRHEGVVDQFDTCSHCETPLKNVYVSQGEAFCELHIPLLALVFSDEEAHFLRLLLETRRVSELNTLTICEDLHTKINNLFNSAFN